MYNAISPKLDMNGKRGRAPIPHPYSIQALQIKVHAMLSAILPCNRKHRLSRNRSNPDARQRSFGTQVRSYAYKWNLSESHRLHLLALVSEEVPPSIGDYLIEECLKSNNLCFRGVCMQQPLGSAPF